MNLKFNKERAIEICKKMISAYQTKKGIFSRKNIFPETRQEGMNDVDYAQFLFYSNILNYSTDARVLYRRLNELNFKLTTDNILSYDEKLTKLARTARFANEARLRIRTAARQLKEDYDGNPLNLISLDIKETYKNIESINGYGTKLARLLVIWYNKYGLSNYKENELEQAVDLHTFRMCLNTGIIKVKRDEKNRYPKDKSVIPLTDFFADLCKENDFSGLALDEAFWAIGSKVCTPAIRKRHDIPCKINCPIEKLCNKEIYVPVKYIPKKHSREAGRENITRSSNHYVERVGKLKKDKTGVDGKYFTTNGKLNTEQEVFDLFKI